MLILGVTAKSGRRLLAGADLLVRLFGLLTRLTTGGLSEVVAPERDSIFGSVQLSWQRHFGYLESLACQSNAVQLVFELV
jgi:hypothetical protein